MLENIKIQLQEFYVQREQAAINLQQLNGAIAGLEMIIKKEENSIKENESISGQQAMAV